VIAECSQQSVRKQKLIKSSPILILVWCS